jgi:hypothetical protein
MPSKHQGEPSPPGYISPKRASRKPIQTFVEPGLYNAFREVAADQKMTVQDAAERLVHNYVRRHGKPYNIASKTLKVLSAQHDRLDERGIVVLT